MGELEKGYRVAGLVVAAVGVSCRLVKVALVAVVVAIAGVVVPTTGRFPASWACENFIVIKFRARGLEEPTALPPSMGPIKVV